MDDDLAHRKVLAVMLGQAGMVCTMASSAAEALTVLRTDPVDAVIADLNMPGVSGLDLLTEIKRHYPRLVFLMATGLEDVRLGVQAMRVGADDYLIKPLQLDVVMVSLERAFHRQALEQEVAHYRQHLEDLVSRRTSELRDALGQVERSYVETLDALGSAIDLRDRQTAGHSRRVALGSIKILTDMHGTPQQLKHLAMGAWLHDIGKLAIPDAILLKPGALTLDERRIMEGHVQIGYDLVKSVLFLADASEIILSHHERWNGTGYPRGLTGHDIPRNARIFAVVDTVDAMTSDRPYQSALSFQDARDMIQRQAGIHFDPEVAEVFLSISPETWHTIRERAVVTPFSAALATAELEHPADAD